MGLDMYLYRKSRKYRQADGTLISSKGLDFKDYYKSDEFGCGNGVEISENVAYWRKANEIHHWFVQNVQDGEDDCKEYDVPIEYLHTLYDLCKKIVEKARGSKMWIEDKDENGNTVKKDETIFDPEKIDYTELWHYNMEITDEMKELIDEELHPSEGFFFGSTDIDGGYFYDLIKTMKMFDRIFANAEKDEDDYVSYSYQASW